MDVKLILLPFQYSDIFYEIKEILKICLNILFSEKYISVMSVNDKPHSFRSKVKCQLDATK